MLIDESDALVGAGTDTVGSVCNIGFFHILNNREVRKKLVAEVSDFSTHALRSALNISARIYSSRGLGLTLRIPLVLMFLKGYLIWFVNIRYCIVPHINALARQ